ncbi:LOW QUALITY PROTEIN: interleukin-13 receptor subunit alpha-2-like [Pelodytes ibericus]
MRFIGFLLISRFLIYTTICLTFTAKAQTITVDPPSSFHIDDPGYLGMLDIHWRPPATISAFSQCKVLYELHFQSTGDKLWRSIRTRQLKHIAAFNLNKEIIVKLRTYLKGSCVNESQAWSEWIEAKYSVPLKGSYESQIRDFQCIFYGWEILKCTWLPGKQHDPSSNYELQYWYQGLAQKKTCDSYLESDNTHVGCTFQRDELGSHTELFLCVTGISDLNPIRTLYFMLNLQDIVKPAPLEELTISMTKPSEFTLEWEPPKGKVPGHCLIYEIQSKDQNNIWKIYTEQLETTASLFKPNSSHILCTRIRSKVNIFCANDGFWSDWSPQKCWKEPSTYFTNALFYCVGGSIILVILLCVTALFVGVKTRRLFCKICLHKAKELVFEMDASNMLH